MQANAFKSKVNFNFRLTGHYSTGCAWIWNTTSVVWEDPEGSSNNTYNYPHRWILAMVVKCYFGFRLIPLHKDQIRVVWEDHEGSSNNTYDYPHSEEAIFLWSLWQVYFPKKKSGIRGLRKILLKKKLIKSLKGCHYQSLHHMLHLQYQVWVMNLANPWIWILVWIYQRGSLVNHQKLHSLILTKMHWMKCIIWPTSC